MKRIEPCNENDYPALAEIWERSARATHSFLTEKDVVDIRESLMHFPMKILEQYI